MAKASVGVATLERANYGQECMHDLLHQHPGLRVFFIGGQLHAVFSHPLMLVPLEIHVAHVV